MQDSFDALSLHTGQTPDLMIEMEISSPRMISPSDEMNNPFFISTTGPAVIDKSAFGPIKDAPSSRDAQKRQHLFTPLDLSWFSFLKESTTGEEDIQTDYFSLATSLKRQRRSPSPTHYSATSSHTSCASSSPPSESGSEFLDYNSQIDFEVESLEVPMASFALPTLHDEGMHMGMDTTEFKDRYDSLMMPASEVTIRSHRKPQDNGRGLQSIMSLNTFNLSDFISDHHDQDQVSMQKVDIQQQQQNQAQQQLMHAIDLSSSNMTSSERPFYHRNVRSLNSVKDPVFSPMSSMFPLGMDHHHLHASQGFHLDQQDSMSKQMMDSSALYSSRPTQDYFTNRPKLPLRVYSNPLESLSCNPSQITPGQELPPMDPMSEDGSCFFSSSSSPSNSGHGDNYEMKLGGGDDEVGIQPPAPYGYSSNGYSNLWSLAKSDAYPRDNHQGHSSSPLLGQEQRLMKLNHPSPATTSMYIEDQNRQMDSESQQYGLGLQGIPRRGGIRSSRLNSLTNSRQSASPYQSPVLDQARLESDFNGTRMTIGGQVITGIITKRSRGRRVPSNPEELNNLGKSGKVYTCKVPGCGKCFKRSEHLKRHVRSIHTNEKPFTCHCGKTFSRHDNLNQHARVHGTENSPASLQASMSPPPLSPTTFPSSSFGSPLGGSRRGSTTNARSQLRKIEYYEEQGNEHQGSDF